MHAYSFDLLRGPCRAFNAGVSDKEMMEFWCYLMEWTMAKLTQLSRKHGRLVRMYQIKDLYGLSLWQASVSGKDKNISTFIQTWQARG